MSIELINTGSELLLGRVLNTHQQWICRRLSDLGYSVDRQVAVPDTADAIRQAVEEATHRAEIIIVTGGLGPTSDDLTRDRIAELFGLSLHPDPEVMKNLDQFFSIRHKATPESAKAQALVPQGATVLHNKNGTAPGLVIRPSVSGVTKAVILLPGPPRELRPMFIEQVEPLLGKEYPPEIAFASRTFRTLGLGESAIEERIAPRLASLTASNQIELGYCAHMGAADVRIAARGCGASEVLDEAEALIRSELGGSIFGVGDEQIEHVVVRLLTEQQKTLATAESCTGGLISDRLTNVPGASKVFRVGVITYSNEAKKELLGVSAATLEKFGAVSRETVTEMAQGAGVRYQADIAVAISGIAGPSGGSEAKPVGTVFIAVASAAGVQVAKFRNPYDRETFKVISYIQALDMVRRALLADGIQR